MLLRKTCLLLAASFAFAVQCAAAEAAFAWGYEERLHYFASPAKPAVLTTPDYLIDLITQGEALRVFFLRQRRDAAEKALFRSESARETNKNAASLMLPEAHMDGSDAYTSGGRSVSFTRPLRESSVFSLASGGNTSLLAAKLFARARVSKQSKAGIYECFAAWPEFRTSNLFLDALINSAASNAAHKRVAEVIRVANAAHPHAGAADGGAADALPYSAFFDYEITRFDQDFVSLRFDYSEYLGGAHPIHSTESLIVSLKGGVRRIALRDIIRKERQGELRLLVQQRLAAQGALWAEDAEYEHSTFTLRPDGAGFLFDPYAAGPYAQGRFEVFFTWREIAPYIKIEF